MMITGRRRAGGGGGGLVLLLCACACACVQAIYEDQAGTFDWHRQHVGRPRWAAFLPGRERIYVATEAGQLASLRAAAPGAVAWRRAHPDDDALDAVLALHKPPLLVAASRGGKHLRAWEASEGGFRWEAVGFEGPPVPGAGAGLAAVDLPGGSGKGAAVALAAGDRLQLVNATRGETLWSAELQEAGAALRKLLVAADGALHVVAFTPGSAAVHLRSYAAATGEERRAEQLSTEAPLGGAAAVSGGAVAFLSPDSKQLCTLAATGSAPSIACQALSSLTPELAEGGAAPRLTAAGPGSFSLSSPAGVAIVAVGGGGARRERWVAGATAASPAAPAGKDASSSLLAAAAASADGSSLSVRLLDAAGGAELASASVAVPLPPYPTHGPAPAVAAVWLDAARRKPEAKGLAGCQLLVLWSDDQLALVAGGAVAWAREEALASGTADLLIDLPASSAAAAAARQQQQQGAGGAAAGAAAGGVVGLLRDRAKLKRWMRLQWLSVLVQFKLNTDPESEEFYELRQALSDNNLPFRDTSGFRKLVVVLTAPGKLFALHSGDGRIMWAASGLGAAAAAGPGRQRGQYLRLWRRFHDLTHAPQLAVLGAGDGAGASAVAVVDGHTGRPLERLELGYDVDKVVPLSEPAHDGAADQFAFLLVEAQPQAGGGTAAAAAAPPPTPRVHLLPDAPAVRDQLARASGSLFFWTLEQQQQGEAAGGDEQGAGEGGAVVLRGFGLEAGAAPGEGGLLPVVPAWQVVLPGQLLGLASKDPAEPVHSYVKILGDRSFKYNYLNPNLLFVATGPPPGAAARLPPERRSVSVALVNTVTGAVLHHAEHEGCAGPVHAVASENWVVYLLRDVVALRQQATVLELYDASAHDLSIESVLLGRTKHAPSLSSYSPAPLEVLSQSFYLQHSAKGLGVTQSKQGITTKQLLVRTVNDQLYALDKRFLDPRRPLRAKATPEEAEERLLPYNELVVFSTLNYPTLDKQVFGLSSVSVAPTVLESTTLLFCRGADLFFTRLSPAANFDTLAADFSYGLLIAALLALVGGTAFARYSSQQAMLKAKWQ